MSTKELIAAIQADQLEDNDSTADFYIPEKYQLGILTDYLDTHGFKYVTEGRIFCYPIDLLCARGETTVAIEMKSGKVSRGIEQAWRNSDFVDFSYLAVWEERVTDSLIENISETPAGLFAVGESVEQVCPPTKTPVQLCSRDMVYSSIQSHVRDDTSV